MKLKPTRIPMLLSALSLGTATFAHSTDVHRYYPKPKPYPLKTCLVTKETLSQKPFVFTHSGRQIKLCCKICLGEFKKDPAKYIRSLPTGK